MCEGIFVESSFLLSLNHQVLELLLPLLCFIIYFQHLMQVLEFFLFCSQNEIVHSPN